LLGARHSRFYPLLKPVTPEELNDRCIARLNEADLASRVAVVGSGPSSPYIAPIGKLEELLGERCGLEKEQEEPFWKFAERAHETNANEYFRVIRETYEETPYWSADVYRHLIAMPFKAFATFNYDDQLPKAFRGRYPDNFAEFFSVYPPRNNSTYFSPPELLQLPPRLIAVHGYCDPENDQWERQAILRIGDYNQHYGAHPAPLFDWWRNMLMAAPCFFVGTSLYEPGLHRVIEYLLPGCRDHLEQLGHVHLVHMPANRYDENSPPGRSLTVIEQVYYDRVDGRYTGLQRVLSKFSGLPTDRPSPRVPTLKTITATDNFDFDAT
jgi:SIR2-like domain